MTLFAKYKQTILYLIFGVLSTIVNILTYTFCTRKLNIEFLISNPIVQGIVELDKGVMEWIEK